MKKQAFQVQTTSHPNAVYGQAQQAKDWLNSVLAEIARNSGQPNGQGPTVTVVIEVFE